MLSNTIMKMEAKNKREMQRRMMKKLHLGASLSRVDSTSIMQPPLPCDTPGTFARAASKAAA